jgi:hypothetical protein
MRKILVIGLLAVLVVSLVTMVGVGRRRHVIDGGGTLRSAAVAVPTYSPPGSSIEIIPQPDGTVNRREKGLVAVERIVAYKYQYVEMPDGTNQRVIVYQDGTMLILDENGLPKIITEDDVDYTVYIALYDTIGLGDCDPCLGDDPTDVSLGKADQWEPL